MILAAEFGHTEVVSTLLDRGAEVEAKDSIDRTALMIAAYKGLTDTVSILLEHGANVNAARSDGFTALMFAAFKGHAGTVSTLLARSDINLEILHEQLNHPSLQNLNKGVSELLADALPDEETRNSFMESFDQRNPNDIIQRIQPVQQAPNFVAPLPSQTSPFTTIYSPNSTSQVASNGNGGCCIVS